VEELERREDESFVVRTNMGSEIACKVVVIAAGLGCFEPRKPEIPNIEAFENKGVSYMILDPEKYRGKKVVLAGGGDSALDWTIFLADIASELTLVHRNETFRGAVDSAEKVAKLAEEGKIRLLLSSQLGCLAGEGQLQTVEIINKQKESQLLEADYLIPLFGLSPKLGPIEGWGLNLDKSAIEVNVHDYSTNVTGIYAIGDINTYPGKLKLILCGFHEAALMAQTAFKRVYPDQKLSFKYTTVNGVNAF
jgi:thioredoxin reductase (NADPH)